MPTGPRAGRNLQKRRGVVRELGMKKRPSTSFLTGSSERDDPFEISSEVYALREVKKGRGKPQVGNK
jgi:hypothetical protein